MNSKILGIDIGSFQISAIIAEHSEDGLSVIGMGTQKAQGVKRGVITNIELAAKSIKSALLAAQAIAGTEFDQVVVSISGAYTKSLETVGFVNLPEHEINIAQIERAMKMADDAANIPADYEKIHILPFKFKVDSQDNIEDPHGMMGDRLEVYAHVIIAQKSTISNIRKAVQKAGVSVDNIVLSGYASAIATLTDDEKDLGAALIDMGGETCNLVIHSGNSIRYNDFLGVGSNHITKDLSEGLHTPIAVAEDIKITLGNKAQHNVDTIDVPNIADDEIKQVSVDIVMDLIYSRLDETLMILANMLENSKHQDLAGAGVVLTGGMTKIEGIRQIATAIFDKRPVRIARPKPLQGLVEVMEDPMYSCAVGLCLYGAGSFTQYEIDSEKKMRYRGEKLSVKERFGGNLQDISQDIVLDDEMAIQLNERDNLANIAEINNQNTGFAPINWLKGLWAKFSQLF